MEIPTWIQWGTLRNIRPGLPGLRMTYRFSKDTGRPSWPTHFFLANIIYKSIIVILVVLGRWFFNVFFCLFLCFCFFLPLICKMSGWFLLRIGAVRLQDLFKDTPWQSAGRSVTRAWLKKQLLEIWNKLIQLLCFFLHLTVWVTWNDLDILDLFSFQTLSIVYNTDCIHWFNKIVTCLHTKFYRPFRRRNPPVQEIVHLLPRLLQWPAGAQRSRWSAAAWSWSHANMVCQHSWKVIVNMACSSKLLQNVMICHDLLSWNVSKWECIKMIQNEEPRQ